MAPVIRIRTESGEELLDLEEFEARVRRGELAGHCPVQFAPLTGERFVRADQLEIFRRHHRPRTLYFARAFNLGRFPRLTAAFVLLDVGLYLAMGLYGPVDQDALVAWGAKAAPLMWDLGQMWRLWTANLLHATPLHIVFNLFVLFNVGGALENAFRPLDYLLLLAASALGTTAMSLWAAPGVTVGASGIVYGTFGGVVVFGIKYRDILPERYRRILGEATIPIVLAFLYIGFTSSGVDNWAHLGGLTAGTLTALVLKPRLLQERPTSARSVVLRLSPLALAALATVVAGAAIARRGPAMVAVDDDPLGIRAQVPSTWVKTTKGFGQMAFDNGLTGVGRASFGVSAHLGEGGGSLDEAVETFVQRSIAPEEKAGNITDIAVHPARPASVGGQPARLLEASYADDGLGMRLKAYLVRRGELVYELIFQWSEQYPAYEELIDRMVKAVELTEPRALRQARARALVDPEPANLQALGDVLQRVGEPVGAQAALEWAVELRPEDGDAQARLAQALLGQGKVDEGCRAAEAAVGFFPESAGSLEVMADCRLAQGDRLEAARYLRKAVQAAPRNGRLAGKLERLQ